MFPPDPNPTATQKRAVKKMQSDVAKYIESDLLAPGHIAPYKRLAFSTLVYACALKPDAHIVRIIMQRLLAEDEANLPTTQIGMHNILLQQFELIRNLDLNKN